MSYLALVEQFAEVAQRRDANLAEIEMSYVDGVAALDATAGAAQQDVERAVAAVASATTALADTDAEAERIWRALRDRLGRRGRRGRRLDSVPEPVESTVDARDARDLLVAAAARVARSARRDTGGELPTHILAALPAVGAAAACGIGLVAGGLAALADAGFSALGALAWLVFLAAPFGGLPPAYAWAVRRYRARLDGGAIGLTVLGGMVACCALIVALH